MKRRSFFSAAGVLAAAGAVLAMAKPAEAQNRNSYHSRQNQQNRQAQRMQQGAQRAFGSNNNTRRR